MAESPTNFYWNARCVNSLAAGTYLYLFMNSENGQKRLETIALLQPGFAGLALYALVQYQKSTIPEMINAIAI